MSDTIAIGHPFADAVGPGWVGTENTEEVVALSTAMSDFLRRAARSELAPIVVTAERGRLTGPLHHAITDLGGRWVVRTDQGRFYDAHTGAELNTPEQALQPTLLSQGRLSEVFLRAPLVNSMRMVVSFSTRHRISRPIRLGGVTETVGEQLGATPVAWGATEPVVAAWDREQLTQITRRRMPDPSRWIAVGDQDHAMVSVIKAQRTVHGIEEQTTVEVDYGPPGDPRHRNLRGHAEMALRAATLHGTALFGFAFAHVGATDLSRRSMMEPPIQPLAIFVGAPAVRSMQVPVASWVAEFDASVLGRPKLPSLLVGLGDADGGGWEKLNRILAEFSAEQLSDVLRGSQELRGGIASTRGNHG